MAEFLSEDHYWCSICIDVFSEPVSIPCGHNFCKDCLRQHWGVKEQRQCPLCKETYGKGLKIQVNTALRDIVENLKKHQQTDGSGFPIQRGQVPCDYCPGNKVPALKTCLVCLTSFCKRHLEPHQRVPALRSHKLTAPVLNLEDKICKKHNQICQEFCKSAQTPLCAQCTEHEAHNTVPLEEGYVDKKAWKRKIESKKRTQQRNNVTKSNRKNTEKSDKTKTQKDLKGPMLELKPQPTLLFIDPVIWLVLFLNGGLVWLFPGLTLNDQMTVFFIPFEPEKDTCGQRILKMGKEMLRCQIGIIVSIFFIALVFAIIMFETLQQ